MEVTTDSTLELLLTLMMRHREYASFILKRTSTLKIVQMIHCAQHVSNTKIIANVTVFIRLLVEKTKHLPMEAESDIILLVESGFHFPLKDSALTVIASVMDQTALIVSRLHL